MYLEIYLVICLIVGAIGAARRCGFFIAFIVSLFASPIIGLLVVIVSPAKAQPQTPSLIWYKCRWCGYRSQINHDHCPKCALDDKGVPK